MQLVFTIYSSFFTMMVIFVSAVIVLQVKLFRSQAVAYIYFLLLVRAP